MWTTLEMNVGRMSQPTADPRNGMVQIAELRRHITTREPTPQIPRPNKLRQRHRRPILRLSSELRCRPQRPQLRPRHQIPDRLRRHRPKPRQIPRRRGLPRHRGLLGHHMNHHLRRHRAGSRTLLRTTITDHRIPPRRQRRQRIRTPLTLSARIPGAHRPRQHIQPPIQHRSIRSPHHTPKLRQAAHPIAQRPDLHMPIRISIPRHPLSSRI
jgi:hypothetical protein